MAPGDAVAVQLTHRLECVVAYQAVLLCGAVLVPIVHLYGQNEVAFISPNPAPRCSSCRRVTGRRYTLTAYLGTHALPRWNTSSSLAPSRDGYLSWSELVAAPGDYVKYPPEADAVCTLLYTSGTTPAPKGVQHSHNSVLAEQRTLPDVIAGDPTDVSLVVFPPGHIAGAIFTLRPFISGGRALSL
jgi:acyl-coenzyme A synthetase/AMP-(fatty) acid ligase